MDEVVELEKMENVCRLCLSTDEPKSSVFGTQNAPISLASKIQACLSIQVRERCFYSATSILSSIFSSLRMFILFAI